MLRGYESLRLSLSGIKLASLRQYAAFNALSSLSLNASPHRPYNHPDGSPDLISGALRKSGKFSVKKRRLFERSEFLRFRKT